MAAHDGEADPVVRPLAPEVQNQLGGEQRRNIAKGPRPTIDPVARRVVDIVILSPFADSVAAEVGRVDQGPVGSKPPLEVDFESTTKRLVDVGPQGQADLRELTRQGDLVGEFHGVEAGMQGQVGAPPIDSSFEVDNLLVTYRLQIVRYRSVVLARQQIESGRLSLGATYRSIDAELGRK